MQTGGVTFTRGADVAAFNGAALTLLKAAQGSIVVQIDNCLSAAGSDRIIGVNVSGAGYMYRSSNTTAVTRNASTPLTATMTGTGWTLSTLQSAALGWSSAGRSIVAGLGTLATDTNIASVPASVWLGADNGVSSFENCYNSRIDLYKVRLKDRLLKLKAVGYMN
jgi:hypothetical protein